MNRSIRIHLHHQTPEQNSIKGLAQDLGYFVAHTWTSFRRWVKAFRAATGPNKSRERKFLPRAASRRHLAATQREVTAGSNSCWRIMTSRRMRKLEMMMMSRLMSEEWKKLWRAAFIVLNSYLGNSTSERMKRSGCANKLRSPLNFFNLASWTKRNKYKDLYVMMNAVY